MRVVLDVEADGLIEEATKIHCISYFDVEEKTLHSLSDNSLIKEFLKQKDLTVIGHNIVRYDVPVLEKLLEIEIKAVLIDTLPLSWVLYSQYSKHGLEAWGERLNIRKIEINDWKNLSTEEYIKRCEQDVRINYELWKRQAHYLKLLYGEEDAINKYLEYLSFKMDCIREQEKVGIKIDVAHCKERFETLSQDKEEKTTQLKSVMPKSAIKKKTVYKDALTDENGNITQKGDLFFDYVNSQTNSDSREITKEVIKGYKEPNPNSQSQIKDWLYSLGWIPEHIKHVRDKDTNEVKKIPQISAKTGGGEICPSVQKLFDKEPNLKLLEGLGILSHRISVFEGFIKNLKEDRVYPTCMGLTNTLRIQHSVVQNLPSIDKKYGEDVRKSLIADEGKLLVGSDLSGIEANTRNHYIYKWDPKYVDEMNEEGYDSHLDIAVLAGILTKQQAEDHKQKKANYKLERQRAKQVNFSAIYGVKEETLSRNMGVSLKEAKSLLDAFWKRNWAIKKVADRCKVKEIYGQKWLYNPISKFWYSLRAEKDRFSTLNQGSAVYVFDTWLKYIRQQGIKVAFQMHDEIAFNTDNQELAKRIIEKSIQEVNKELKLNVTIKCSFDVGNNYAEIH